MKTQHINRILESSPRLKSYHGVGPVQRAAVEDFADSLYKDIMLVVSAHVLSGDSAVQVFKNLKKLYED